MTTFARSSESAISRSAAQSVRVAARLRSDMLGFAVIFAAALAGFASVGIWAAAGCAIALASLSYAEHYQLYRRGQELGRTEVLRNTTLRSFANALIAAGGAYAGGCLLQML